MLLHRNLSGLLTIAEALKSMGSVDRLFWESLQEFLASQLTTLPSDGFDQLINLSNIFIAEGQPLSSAFSSALSKYMIRYLKTKDQDTIRTGKELAKISRLLPHLNTDRENLLELEYLILSETQYLTDSISFTQIAKILAFCNNLELNPSLKTHIINSCNEEAKFNSLPLTSDFYLEYGANFIQNLKGAGR